MTTRGSESEIVTSSAFGSYQYPRSISVKVATGIEHQILEIKDFHFLVCCSLIRDTSSVEVVQTRRNQEENPQSNINMLEISYMINPHGHDTYRHSSYNNHPE